MFIYSVLKDSVLYCFCQSCSPNAVKGGKITPIHRPKKCRTNLIKCTQPNRLIIHALEVRAEEKTPGGMKYDAILVDAKSDSPFKATETTPKSLSAEDIANKLKAAEERKKYLEDMKQAKLEEKLSKITEASVKREELNIKFINQTKDALEHKMETSDHNREQYLSSLKARVKEHVDGIEKARATLELETQEIRESIEEKLRNAEEQRKDQIQKMISKLKEHEDNVQKKRLNHVEQLNALKESIQTKLDNAEKKRESERLKMVENLREHNLNVVNARIKVETDVKINEEKVLQLVSNKLNQAALKREINRDNLMKKCMEKDKHIEKVRQNKKSGTENTLPEEAV